MMTSPTPLTLQATPGLHANTELLNCSTAELGPKHRSQGVSLKTHCRLKADLHTMEQWPTVTTVYDTSGKCNPLNANNPICYAVATSGISTLCLSVTLYYRLSSCYRCYDA